MAPLSRLRIAICVGIAFAAFASTPALAGPVSGRLTVTPEGESHLLLSMSVQHQCAPPASCGWFAVVDQVSAAAPCPATPAAPLWVGPITEAPSAAYTTVEQPYGWSDGREPIRLCLMVDHESGFQTVADVVYTPPAPPPAAPPPPPTSSPPIPPASPPAAEVPINPTVTLAEARRYVRTALRRRFGRRFTDRRDFRMTCARLSRIRFRCRVSWRHKGRYEGTVTIWSSLEDDTAYFNWKVNVRYRRPPAPPPRPRQPERKPEPKPQQPSTSCDPSYPGVCIPPPPPDLDCPEIAEQDFRVRGSDPHGFDGDDDGVGCES
jgi:hypothetical protein